jgi:hypothetical protein
MNNVNIHVLAISIMILMGCGIHEESQSSFRITNPIVTETLSRLGFSIGANQTVSGSGSAWTFEDAKNFYHCN